MDQGQRFVCLPNGALSTNLGIRKTNKQELWREILLLYILCQNVENHMRQEEPKPLTTI